MREQLRTAAAVVWLLGRPERLGPLLRAIGDRLAQLADDLDEHQADDDGQDEARPGG